MSRPEVASLLVDFDGHAGQVIEHLEGGSHCNDDANCDDDHDDHTDPCHCRNHPPRPPPPRLQYYSRARQERGGAQLALAQSRERYCDLLAAFSKSQLVGLLADACVMLPSDVGKAVHCFDQDLQNAPRQCSVGSGGPVSGGKACGDSLCGFEGETLDGKWWNNRFREDEVC